MFFSGVYVHSLRRFNRITIFIDYTKVLQGSNSFLTLNKFEVQFLKSIHVDGLHYLQFFLIATVHKQNKMREKLAL